MEKNRIILSLKDIVVKFRVRSKMLTSIRNVSFDIYDGETLAIVGESGSGKSVLTKTLTNMLESNGYIASGSIMYYPNEETQNDPEAYFKTETNLIKFHRGALTKDARKSIKSYNKSRVKKAKIQIGILNKQIEQNIDVENSQKTIEALQKEINAAHQEMASFNRLSLKMRLKVKPLMKILQANNDVSALDEATIDTTLACLAQEDYLTEFEAKLQEILQSAKAKEKVELQQIKILLEFWEYQNQTYFKNKYQATKDLKKLRGGTIATIFQDPMTSLNPLLSVGEQISEVLRKHQNLSHAEAKAEAINLMKKVKIPNAENRYKDIPGKYSGGMRQRIVIAIALACKPRILICDEPTTALDVTIQAQILDLIKELKVEYNLTVIFITHDLGVVANIADRVAVVYAGQIIEYGTTHDIYFNPQHPYTWALLCALPQLGEKGEELFSIAGTPPSLFNEIKGDPFAPRNEFALAIDYEVEPPMFEISKTHGAKTWLLDPRAPKIKKPKQLNKLHETISASRVGE
ncbi:oligopeptide/dipeptide ABC transporter ATP-binding protein [Williamsoniiplasma luminosum]|uniref:ABC transporter ATP-binding protein n=1 Tax=Williamsoniiplasma luminosum TaxID=214888 RepID=A0A2S0NJW9_9MOLU|nr:oligopeptide/dipeptide ABC transporter ATP-binding protein [Williamsoniiplasma luminosum]AVP49301.1 MAG: ABC transporter ATP-binding protein [Williamsoniiplasma luminosum]